MTGNRLLAEQARQLADGSAGGSLQRKAALCCAVALGTTTTTAAARKALAGGIGPADVRAAATELLDTLTTERTRP